MATLCGSWATIDDACGPCTAFGIDTTAVEAGMLRASEILFNLTGQRWQGTCAETLRPCSRYCRCTSGCGCGWVDEWVLPGYPVTAVSQVKIDGAIVNPATYRLDKSSRLVRLSGPNGQVPGQWPACQRLELPTTEVDTWSITYSYGALPTPGGVAAAATLGCEIALACQPADSDACRACRLPRRVQTIVRQGVSMTILDPLTIFADGLVGLPEVDLWLASVRIGDARRLPAIGDANRYIERYRRI